MSFTLRGLTIHDPAGAAIVTDIALAGAPGEAIIVIGETGSGKSLIAQAMLGLLPPGFAAVGRLSLPGLPAVDLSDPAAARSLWSRGTLLIPQEPRTALDPTMRVGAQLDADPAGGRATAMLESVGLAPAVRHAYPYALSSGMAQRVVIASTLASTASIIVIDEPTKGLDPDRIDQVAALLHTLLREGRSLLVITHDLRLAQRLGGCVAVLRERSIVESRPAQVLFAAPSHDYTRAWLSAHPTNWPKAATGAGGEVLLAARGLAFGYRGDQPLFSGIDLTVRRGAVVALAGPSGSGKTTLGNILIGLQAPTAGRVSWPGPGRITGSDADPYRDRAAHRRLRRRYQKLHQDPVTAFVPHRPIRRQLHDLAEVVPDLRLAARLPPLLDRLGLRDPLLDRYPAEVSSGEAQRLALARLLLLDPLVIVADEPTSRLDPIMQREIIDLLRQVLHDPGIGLVLVSHDRALIASLTDDVTTLMPASAGAAI